MASYPGRRGRRTPGQGPPGLPAHEAVMQTNLRSGRSTIVLAAALAGGVHLPALAQDQPAATFRSAVDLVRVDVNVLDRDGRPVPGLGVSDFTVEVDGRPRK